MKPHSKRGVLPPQFVATPETHSASTDDAFYKAKSEEYLLRAEGQSDQDDAARNAEDGWPYADHDIGDAEEQR